MQDRNDNANCWNRRGRMTTAFTYLGGMAMILRLEVSNGCRRRDN